VHEEPAVGGNVGQVIWEHPPHEAPLEVEVVLEVEVLAVVVVLDVDVVVVVFVPPVPLTTEASTTTLPPQAASKKNDEKKRIEPRLGRSCPETEAPATASRPRRRRPFTRP
jgi:hypothetical protein